MPTVPTYDSPQVTPNTLPQGRFAAPEMPDIADRQTQQMGEGLMQAGGAAGRIAADMQNTANKVRVDEANTSLVKQATALKIEAMSLQGKNALERPDGQALPDEYSKKLQQSIDEIESGLGNDAQRAAFRQQASALGIRLYGTLSEYMVQQQGKYREEVWDGKASAAVQRGTLLYGDASERAAAASDINAVVDDMKAANGWDAGEAEKQRIAMLTPLHAGITKALLQAGDAQGAKAYYDEHSAEMTLQSRAALQDALKGGIDLQTAMAHADSIWGEIGPKSANDPVNIFDMEQRMRADLSGNPDALTKGIAELRSRAAAFNAQQSEQKAQAVSSVWKLHDSGIPLSRIQQSDAWLALTGNEQHSIIQGIESEAATQASRAASNSARQLSDMQRGEKLAFLKNGDEFLTATDPDVLAKMSRAQVEAMRSKFGMEATQHLLSKWDALQQPGKLPEARMDAQDFNQVADSLGLHPYAKGQDEDAKRKLGTLQFRVEQLIDSTQQQVKRPLTRDEKMTLMRTEMAKTVTVPGWLSDSQVPVIQLDAAQAANVSVPASDRAQIVQALQAKYKQNPANPLYAPTEANVKRLYLMGKSRAGALVGQ